MKQTETEEVLELFPQEMPWVSASGRRNTVDWQPNAYVCLDGGKVHILIHGGMLSVPLDKAFGDIAPFCS